MAFGRKPQGVAGLIAELAGSFDRKVQAVGRHDAQLAARMRIHFDQILAQARQGALDAAIDASMTLSGFRRTCGDPSRQLCH
jgi:hypothetical protein